jgi:hypothetical protein
MTYPKEDSVVLTAEELEDRWGPHRERLLALYASLEKGGLAKQSQCMVAWTRALRRS